MIHPNRTYLLQLKQKRATVAGSLSILKARRQALLFEFLASVRPFLRSRRQLKGLYTQALAELRQARGAEGEDAVSSIALVNTREDQLVIEKKNILGVSYYDVVMPGGIRRAVDGRHYDFTASSPHLEEAADRMETVVEAMLSLAAFEIKVRRLGEEILRVSRRSRVLEERVLPDLAAKIKCTDQYIGEREREEYFRLKRFKNLHG
ncbi:MAG: V-type ATP synthase subunit D [Desulfobulbaceae bacterium]